MLTSRPTAEQIAAIFGCTVDQVKSLARRNAEVCRRTADSAEKSGRKINGYTSREWRNMAKDALRHEVA